MDGWFVNPLRHASSMVSLLKLRVGLGIRRLLPLSVGLDAKLQNLHQFLGLSRLHVTVVSEHAVQVTLSESDVTLL